MRILLSLSVIALGCSSDLPECDSSAMSQATRVVYDEEGLPAYEGQAILLTSCSGNGFCHSSDAEGEFRWGAPGGLDFDVLLASVDDSEGNVGRLSTAQSNVVEHASLILSEIEGGRMPPYGEATLTAHAGVPRFADEDGDRVPYADDPAGIEALRTWLACGAPVVERTQGSGQVGDVVEPLETEPPEPTFSSIYERVLLPRCGRSCHSPTLQLFLDVNMLDLSTPELAYSSMIDVAAMGDSCADDGTIRVAPMDADSSLLMQKLEDTATCGEAMPQGGSLLPADTLAAIRTWIDDGAQDN